MKKTVSTSILLSSLSLAAMVPSTAMAVEGLSANVGATSNYLWRGVSQTDDGAAISGGIDYEDASGFYAGTWASNIDFGDDASYELDLYLGYAWEVGDFTYDVGYIYYAYPDSAEVDSSNEYDFGEIYGSIGYGAFSLSAFYGVNNDDGAGFADKSLYLSGDAEFEIAPDLTLGLHLGSYNFDDDSSEDYIDFAASLSKDGFTFTVADTDLSHDDLKVVVSYSVDFDL
ncbi:TorF family putative porin [Thalassotalea aquiviva]|uniref:TorF family putative porin n=1 Tax=Thalassotalea aquiviva TaxID=3242415 RepID=UPI00352A0276